jgi:hypothetical protein
VAPELIRGTLTIRGPMSNKNCKLERDMAIADEYFDGMYSQRELADRYGVSRATVRRAIDDYRDSFGNVIDKPEGLPASYDEGQPMYDDCEPQTVPWWAAVGAIIIVCVLGAYAGGVLWYALNGTPVTN